MMYGQHVILTRHLDDAHTMLDQMSEETLLRSIQWFQIPWVLVDASSWAVGEPEADLAVEAIRLALHNDLNIAYRGEYDPREGHDYHTMRQTLPGPSWYQIITSLVDEDYVDGDVEEALWMTPAGRLSSLHPLCGDVLMESIPRLSERVTITLNMDEAEPADYDPFAEDDDPPPLAYADVVRSAEVRYADMVRAYDGVTRTVALPPSASTARYNDLVERLVNTASNTIQPRFASSGGTITFDDPTMNWNGVGRSPAWNEAATWTAQIPHHDEPQEMPYE
jgi:hypothetical protein